MAIHVIGVDLGGTNLRCALLESESLRIICRYETPTMAHEGPEAIIRRLSAAVTETIRQSGCSAEQVAAIGIGAPGPLDGQRGIVLSAPNLPGWSNVPLAEQLQKLCGVRVILENDANAAGWGEFVAGAGRGCRHMVLMTLGTGVGGAVIIDGRLLTGPDWTAGEIGHVVIVDGGRKCNCGSRGCLEAYASATATVARFVEALKFGWQSSLAGRPANSITAADIFDAAAAGDNLALHIVHETGRYLGLMAANLANLLNPERCIFSGGMIKAGNILFDAIRAECRQRAFPAPAARLQIMPAELGEDAGIIGAAACALERLGLRQR